MNVSGDIVWESTYFKSLNSHVTENVFADTKKKRVISFVTGDAVVATQSTIPPVLSYTDLNGNNYQELIFDDSKYRNFYRARTTMHYYDYENSILYGLLEIEGSLIGETPGNYYSCIVKIDIDFENINNTSIIFICKIPPDGLGFLTLANLSENENKAYVIYSSARRAREISIIDGTITKEIVLSNLGGNERSKIIYFDSDNNTCYYLRGGSDFETYLEVVDFENETITKSSNFFEEVIQSTTKYNVNNNNLTFFYSTNFSSGFLQTDFNLNVIKQEIFTVTTAQCFDYNEGVLYCLNCNGSGFYKNVAIQSTKSLPLFSGDSNGTIQTTKDKPLGRNRPHIVEINTANSGVTNSDQFQTTGMLGVYDVYYDNGSGVNGWFYNLTDEQTLTFPQQDVYELHFYGKDNFQGFRFNVTGDRNKLTKILQWGDNVNYRDRTAPFRGCGLLTEVNTPDGVVINGLSPFRQCVSLSTFNVAEMILFDRVQYTFRETNCDVDTTKLKFSAVTGNGIVEMFQLSKVGNIKLTSNIQSSEVTLVRAFTSTGGSADTIDISILKRKKITNLQDGFSSNSGLEKIIGIEYLNTSICSSFQQTFLGTPSLEDMDLSRWDTSNVTIMFNMFNGCGADPGDISNWDISNVTDMSNFITSASKGVTSSVYTQCLIKWSQLQLQQGVNLGMGSTKYDSSAQTAKDYIINTFGWTINDGGQL